MATQRRVLTDHGLREDRIYTDIASGRNMRRPGWNTLRETLQPGYVVVVPRIDRLARNLIEGLRAIEELNDQGINIRSLAEDLDTSNDNPNANLFLRLLLALAEWKRETIRDRIKAGVERATVEGRTGGRPPALDSENIQDVRDLLATGRFISAIAQDRQGEPRHCAGRKGRGVPRNQRGCSIVALRG